MRSRRTERSGVGLAILLLVATNGSMSACGGRAAFGPGRGEALSPALEARPRLGRAATPADVARFDLRVDPEGRALPEGRGTAAEGEPLYIANCLRCHGLSGAGEPADRLVGGVGTLAAPRPIKTVGSYWPYAPMLFDYVRRAMPYDRPGSLSTDEVYAIAAYLLAENGIIDPEQEMNRESLSAVEMPNRQGFISARGAPEER